MKTQPVPDPLSKLQRSLRARHGPLTRTALARQTRAYRGTGGISQENRGQGFAAAFMDTETGEVCVSRWPDGTAAPVHLLDGLPPHWITARSEIGEVTSVRSSVIAGFVRQGRFYNRKQAAALAGQERAPARR